MADFLFGDSANYAPDEFNLNGSKYRPANPPTVVSPHTHLLPLISQEKSADSQMTSVFPTTNTVMLTP